MYIVVNFKQNLDLVAYEDYLSLLLSYVRSNQLNYDLVLCPPFPYLQFFKNKFNGMGSVSIGAQDISRYPGGSHTGEVSASHIKGIADYCIVNHSETIEESEIAGIDLKQKILNLRGAGIKPIICLKKYDSSIKNIGLQEGDFLAFEDPSHIGTGENSSEIEIQEFCEAFGKKFVFLYGGSVSDSNFLKFRNMRSISGLLIGSYALDVNNLIKILKIS